MKIFMLLILSVFTIGVTQGQTLSKEARMQAEKKATAEAKMYEKKAYQTYESKLNIHDLLLHYYKHALLESKSGERVYVSTQGRASDKDKTLALKQANSKAIDRIPSLLAMYFNSWIQADKRSSEKEKKDLIEAVNQVGKIFTQKMKSIKPDHSYKLILFKKDKYYIQLRLLYNQEKIRAMYKKEVIKVLVSQMAWDKIKADRLLSF